MARKVRPALGARREKAIAVRDDDHDIFAKEKRPFGGRKVPLSSDLRECRLSMNQQE